MYYEEPKEWVRIYGEIYFCDAPFFNRCTLFKEKGLGLCVVQQRFDPSTKHTWWGDIDPWLANDIYTNPNFKEYFMQNAGIKIGELYPVVCVRQIMRSLGMPPLKKELWETRF